MKATVGFRVCLLAGGVLAACSGDHGSPTSPSVLPPAGSTTIAGTAREAGATAGPAISPLSHQGSSGPLQVCVVGTEVCATADADGRFELVGDFAGDVALQFTGRGHDVIVTVHDVQPGQTITVSVALDGNTGTLDIESRRGDGAERVQLCHREGNGRYHLIEVSVSAEADHLAHGDGHPGGNVPDTDPPLTFDADCGILGPDVEIEKSTNGEDADRGAGPRLAVGDPITWTYVVTNTGDVSLTDIVVSDSVEGAVGCPKTVLDLGESMTCTLDGTAVAGRYRNVGTVTAVGSGLEVTDTDASHYVGQEPEDADDAGGPAEKVAMCHRTGNGTFRLIEVSVDAEPAHLAHGDGYPGEGGFDATCSVGGEN